MKFKPILFSTPMVRAIMEGRKTQTRRIIKPTPEPVDTIKLSGTKQYLIFENDGTAQIKHKYNIGDILWVRETWCDYNDGYGPEHANLKTDTPHYLYRADCEIFETAKIWRPSIFMPKHACRLFLKVTDVRVERLQDISTDDIKAEGIYGTIDYGPLLFDQWQELWQSINGNWDANPWVWVITFERIEKPEGFYQHLTGTVG